MKTLAILLGEHPCIVNILFGPTTIHYREVLLYIKNLQKKKTFQVLHVRLGMSSLATLRSSLSLEKAE